MQLQHISIGRQIGTETAMRHFYGELLGLQEKSVPDNLEHLNLIWFQLDHGAEIHILVEEPLPAISNRHFCLVVDDVQALRQKLEIAGIDTWDVDVIPGRPRFFTRDPSGNMLEFASITGNYLELQDNS